MKDTAADSDTKLLAPPGSQTMPARPYRKIILKG